MCYLLSWLDRTNLGNARVAGLQKDLKLTNHQYSICLTITFIPYILAELPSNLLLKIVGPNRLIPTLLTLWGIVTTLQGLVHNYAGLLACRFFLGLFEGGLIPGVVLYLSLFYPRERLQRRVSLVFASSSLAGAFSGLLAAGIVKLSGHGGKPGWAWIFFLEGLFTVLFGVLIFFIMPASPTDCRMLNEAEKNYVLQRLRDNGAIYEESDHKQSTSREVFKSCLSPHVIFASLGSLFQGIILYSLSYFAPSIIQGLGYSANSAQLMSVPPYAVAFFVTNLSSYLADRYHCRGGVIFFGGACCVTGFAMFLSSHASAVQYGSLFLTFAGTNAVSPAYTTWAANNSAPHVRRATSIALICMATNAGGILSTWLLGSLSAPPRYTTGTIVLLVSAACLSLSAAANVAYLWYQNRRKAEIRAVSQRTEESAGLGDRSAWFTYIL
ncbi:hypothetical protein HGRIS_005752 [Hohenbuehelia grisea]|uniref:Major facilitator superfamily (MFS) profile domain-containing protein n=1 Tax=Hohenbuehelia grisea TaxID=104357 RepID=A0ABR3JYQ0_9AGAR